jgi:hypothetical protein
MCAVKGDRSRLEPVARMLYVDQGKTLTDIEETLGVSRQTLSEWKARTRTYGEEVDEWDRARAAKEGYEAHLLAVRDSIMEQIRIAPLQASSYLDSLSKVEAILDRRARSAREAAERIAQQKGEMFLAFVRDLIEFGNKIDPDVVRVVESNFDDLIQFGREKYGSA